MTTPPKSPRRPQHALRTPPQAPTESEFNVRHSPPTPQAPLELERPPPDETRRPARIHLVLGPVGAGKSTFAAGLAEEHHAVRLTLDEWMAVLFRPDRPDEGVMAWYVERAARCLEQIWSLTQHLIAVDTDVVLEVGLIRRRERAEFFGRVEQAGLDLTIHVLDASRDVRRQRVEQRNRVRGATFSMVVPPEIFELASDLWEAPDHVECEGREVHFVRTDRTSPE